MLRSAFFLSKLDLTLSQVDATLLNKVAVSIMSQGMKDMLSIVNTAGLRQPKDRVRSCYPSGDDWVPEKFLHLRFTAYSWPGTNKKTYRTPRKE